MISHVTLLAIDQMLMSSAAIPLEMLEAARARLALARQSKRYFSVEIIGQEEGPVSVLGGIPLTPQKTIDQCYQSSLSSDLIIVPALWRNPKPLLDKYRPTINWLRQQYLAGASVFVVGTGVCLLAEAGILDGKPATTHWHYLEKFAQNYPKVNLQVNHLLTQSDRIFCAASVNSGADMMVHLISLLFGRELALQVEQQFSPEVRNPFEKKVFYADGRHQHGDENIAMVQTWLQHNLKEALTLSRLAQMTGLSERQFDRRFKKMVGCTPGQYLQQLRCEQARQLLQDTNLNIADIAAAVGYQDGGYFTRIFKKQAGQTPGQFRQKVRTKLFTSN
ncbi:MAG: helix-turn-helix domain-containing protein [Saccharospirillaceae bacterium]|nr:helix-turn-helix domain-containing protein [Saccharospirillaceae bacterium]